MEIKINTTGKIIKGEDEGWYVKVQSNENSNSYLILISSKGFDTKEGEAYDDWVQDKEHLIDYFEVSDWVIEWLG